MKAVINKLKSFKNRTTFDGFQNIERENSRLRKENSILLTEIEALKKKIVDLKKYKHDNAYFPWQTVSNKTNQYNHPSQNQLFQNTHQPSYIPAGSTHMFTHPNKLETLQIISEDVPYISLRGFIPSAQNVQKNTSLPSHKPRSTIPQIQPN